MLTVDRAVLIEYTVDGKPRRGSGLRVAGNRVLTANHCARGQGHKVIVDGQRSAANVLVCTQSNDVDLAILEAPELADLPAMRVAVIDRGQSATLTDCQALGFPRWKEAAQAKDRARLAVARGFVPTAEGIDPHADRTAPTLMTLKVTGPEIGPHPVSPGALDKPGSKWAGMSGAVVVSGDDEIIGVIRSHNLAEGAGSLTFVPLQSIDTLEESVAGQFWRHLGVEDVGSVARLPASGSGASVVGKIPDRPAGFVNRETLERLTKAVDQDNVTIVCAVTGMRGVGKTHLAAEFARSRLTAGYRLVGWVDAESPTALVDGLALIAERLGVADPAGDSQKSAQLLRDHLNTSTGKGLIVFDNAVDPDLVQRYLPVTGSTHFIITSASEVLGFEGLGAAVEVDLYTRDESVRYLDRTTGLGADEVADAIADELGDLPLALAQGAATIRGQRLTYQRYLDRLRRLPVADLLGRNPGDDYPRSTAAALLLAVAAIDLEENELASSLVRILATLSPAGVQRDLLYTAADSTPNAAHEVAIDAALEHCTQAAIVAWSISDDTVMMHRLVARLIRESAMANDAYRIAVADALRTLRPHLFSYWDFTWDKRELGRHLIGQVQAVWDASVSVIDDVTLLGHLIDARHWTVRQLHASADVSQELEAATRVRDDSLELFGPNDRRTLRAQRDLSDALRVNGRLNESFTVLEEALATASEAFGDDDVETMECRNDLGYALRYSGLRVNESIDHLERTVHDRARVLGEDHHSTMTSRNALAGSYRKVGRLQDAITLYERNLIDRRNALGDTHPQTLFSRGNLAMAYRSAGRYDDARALGEQLLDDREQHLGADHPETMSSRNDLAFTYKSLGMLGEAIALFEANYRDRVRLLGANHPLTLTSQANLARAYGDNGRTDEGIELFVANVATRRELLGEFHPQTLLSKFNLGLVYRSANRPGDAIPIVEKSLRDRLRHLGKRHPDTLVSRHYLGMMYGESGRIDEGLKLLEQNLALRIDVLGDDDLRTQHSRYALALAYGCLRRRNVAIPLFEKALAVRRAVLGDDHPATARTRKRLDQARRSDWDAFDAGTGGWAEEQ